MLALKVRWMNDFLTLNKAVEYVIKYEVRFVISVIFMLHVTRAAGYLS